MVWKDKETNVPIATSGWECNGYLAVYFKRDDTCFWEMSWLDLDVVDFELDSVPEVNTDGKLSFPEWLEKEYDSNMNEYDETLDANHVDEEYEAYYYDNLPKFVRKTLLSNR